MDSKEKIRDILNSVQNTIDADLGFICCLRKDLEHLVVIAQTEGVKEARNVLNEVWDKE